MKKNALTRIELTVFLLGFFVLAACAGTNQGTTIVGNTTVTIGQLSGDQAFMQIPLGVFNDSQADLQSATMDVLVNSVVRELAVRPYDFYSSRQRRVNYPISNLRAGDVVTMVIRIGSQTPIIYSGTVSATADSEAVVSSADLALRNFSAAETAYCDAYAADSTNSNAAFGCFLVKLIALPETTDAQTLLTALQEDPVSVQADIFEEVIDHLVTYDDAGFERFRYTTIYYPSGIALYPDLPLSNILINFDNTVAVRLAQIVLRLRNTGQTMAQMRTDVVALRDNFEELETLLDTVLADPAFTFTIPQDLFASDADLVASYNDARLFMASVKGTIVGLNIFEAYNLGAEISSALLTDGSAFDYGVLTEDLNGTGATVNGVTVDSTPFLTLLDASLITGSETRCHDALQYWSDGMQALIDGETSQLLAPSFDTRTTTDFQNVKAVADDLLTSLATDTLVPLSSVTLHPVAVNLKELFRNPPTASDVTSSDPFVIEGGTIRMVESYFSDLLNGIATF